MNLRRTILLSLVPGFLLTARLFAMDTEYEVIVSTANHETTIAAERVASLFLKETTSWPDGTAVLPVDLSLVAPTRSAFSNGIFGQPTSAIQTYWGTQMREGRKMPPRVKTTGEEVVAYIDANPGAIGYVAIGTKLSKKTRVVTVKTATEQRP